MRVAVYYNNRDIRLEDQPTPRIGPGEVLLQVKASGICGSDVMEWYRINRAPLVLGHEITGKIVEAGTGVEKFKVGDRVVATHHVPCNTCRYCLAGNHSVCDTLRSTHFDPGGFAEYVRVPALNVERGMFPLPHEVSFEEGTLVEPLACVVRSQRVARVRCGASILVIGSGVSGLLQLKLAAARASGLLMACDISEYRLEAAKKAGADVTFPASTDLPEQIRNANEGRLADVVILCTAAPQAVRQSADCIERGGTIILYIAPKPGDEVPLPLWNLYYDGVSIISSYAGPPADMRIALDLIQLKRVSVEDVITHRLGLEETGIGFRLVHEAGESLKVVIDPQR